MVHPAPSHSLLFCSPLPLLLYYMLATYIHTLRHSPLLPSSITHHHRGTHFGALADTWSPSRPLGEGYVSLAVAENKLTYDILRQRLPPLATLVGS